MIKWEKGKKVRLYVRGWRIIEFKLYKEGKEDIKMGRNNGKVVGLEVLVKMKNLWFWGIRGSDLER